MPATAVLQTTNALPFSATAAQVQAELEALPGIGTGNVSVTRTGNNAATPAPPAGGPYIYTVTFQGALAGQDQVLLKSTLTGVLPAGATLTTTKLTNGRIGVNDVQQLTWNTPNLTAGTFTLGFLAIISKTPEVTIAIQWIESVVKADPVLTLLLPGGWWVDAPPTTVAANYGLFTLAGPTDVSGLSGDRGGTAMTATVKAVGKMATYARDLTAAAQRIDELLHQQFNITLSNGFILQCVRTTEISYNETPTVGVFAGSQTKHLGGVYEMTVQQQ